MAHLNIDRSAYDQIPKEKLGLWGLEVSGLAGAGQRFTWPGSATSGDFGGTIPPADDL